ncbi:PSD1 and planctomycete cytochrome C domain-containing protein [Singulisphaera sp. PoT]|uniref:PSD1 and planctomycete cytochrome C domain-containing protein n=1 Tax=Singulisphaera sp. PoT TaxID=3411797 RepID=UPI003BF5CC91
MPLLKARCVKCHGPGEHKAGLSLATPAGMARGGESGPAVIPGKLDESPLWEQVSSGEMPPKDPLSDDEKARLRRWIEAGAPGLPRSSAEIGEKVEHWAFAPLKRPEVPALPEGTSAKTPVDHFIAARLDEAGLKPAAGASRATLIRRLSFGLTGLPPTPEQVAAFEADPAPDAYDRLVERLLGSPAYGERWGKYWLDVAGYADSNGYFNADSERALAWRYRDYVIRAINDDKPFDQFVREQIAGDEVSGYRPGAEVTPTMVEQLVATHFLRNSQDGTGESDGNPDEVRADRYAVLEGTVQILGSSLFGLTLQCARCHDHKFEPVTQRDYYSLQAVLRAALPVDQPDRWKKPAERVVVAAPGDQLQRWEAEQKEIDAQIAAVEAEHRAKRLALREPGVDLFRDGFDERLAPRWQSLALAGTGPIQVDSETPPGALAREGKLCIIEVGSESARRLTTSQSFDWTPEGEGSWIEATFRLVSDRLDPKGTPAQRIGYYIAAHDGSKSTRAGNLLFDGNPDGGAAINKGYPGPDAKQVGILGSAKYTPGRHYGVRVTNVGNGKFRLDHIVEGESEGPAITLASKDLPDGGFGFEYCCGRSFVVDDVTINASDPKVDAPARKALNARLEEARKDQEAAVAKVTARRTPNPGRIAWVTDQVPNPPESHILTRGDYGKFGAKVEPSGVAILSDADNPFEAKPPFEGAESTGRRLALANWFTRGGSRPSMLIARIMVNRIWQQHFGVGLVATSENFGYSGSPPSHPELLEFLADELIRSGWKLKSIQRLIVSSAVYRQSGVPQDEAAEKADPDDRLLSRFPLLRLDAEQVRDAMLAVSGELDPARGGPFVPSQRQGDGEVVVTESTPGAHRRSVYLQQRRTQVLSMLEVFDAPSIVAGCPKRSTSTIPLQSLNLLNSEFVATRASALARRVRDEVGQDAGARIDRTFRLTVGRPPDEVEWAAALRFLASQPAQYAGRPADEGERLAWSDFCQMLLASNPFLYVD